MIATLEIIQSKFEYFNDLCFNGELPPIKFAITKARRFLGKFCWNGRRGFFSRVSPESCSIRISSSFDLTESELEDVLIHEMIHYYIHQKGIRDSSAHGKVFREHMSRINRDFGRHLTISHKGGAIPRSGVAGNSIFLYVGLSVFTDGRHGVTVVRTEKKMKELNRLLPHRYNLSSLTWLRTNDHRFESFPKSNSPVIYKIRPQDEEWISKL